MPVRQGNRIRIGAKRQLTLPRRTMSKLKIREGDYLEVRVGESHIELIPLAIIPRDQAWYWTPDWQAKEREADEDRAAGRVKTFGSASALIRSLRAAAKKKRVRPSGQAR